jgi:Tol biopolymer transport system component
MTIYLSPYSYLSLTADSRTALVTQSKFVAQVWVAPGGDSARARQITSGGPGGVNPIITSSSGVTGISWAPDGRLIYDSDASGNFDIWAANADGSGSKQLTFDAHRDGAPAASPDGRFIVFLTRRPPGRGGIWRMNADGSEAKMLVRNTGHLPLPPRFSPDSRWVLWRFHRDGAGKTSVWKVSVEGGEPVKLLEKEVSSPSLSPDGKHLAVFYREPGPNSPPKILIFPAEGGEPARSLDLPPDANEPLFGAPDQPLGWAPDGRALDFVLTREGASNIWRLSLDGGKPRQLTHWKTDWILHFAWSRDGRQLAVTRSTATYDLVLIRDFR